MTQKPKASRFSEKALRKLSRLMKKRHRDPAFRAKLSASSRKTMERLHRDPEFLRKKSAENSASLKLRHATDETFQRKISKTARKTATRLYADPKFRKAASLRMKKLRREPTFEALRIASVRERTAQEELEQAKAAQIKDRKSSKAVNEWRTTAESALQQAILNKTQAKQARETSLLKKKPKAGSRPNSAKRGSKYPVQVKKL